MARTRLGKIARLPRAIRDGVNQRLADGLTAADILAWLNPQPRVRAILDRYFDGVDISPQNLSEWRGGGYIDWVETQEQEAQIRRLSEMSYQLAQVGGTDLSAGALAIVSSKIYEGLKAVVDVDLTPDEEGEGEPTLDLSTLANAVAKIRDVELRTRAVGQRDKLVHIAERRQDSREREVALAEARFQALAVETFLQWAETESARTILGLDQPKHVKADRLRELMFGPAPTNPD